MLLQWIAKRLEAVPKNAVKGKKNRRVTAPVVRCCQGQIATGALMPG